MTGTSNDLLVLGAALPLAGLRMHRAWMMEKQRDLELQDFFLAEVLNGDWKPLAETIKRELDGYKGRLGIHGPFWGFNIATKDPDIAKSVISHDLRVVHQVSNRVAVMYLGQFVEEGDADDLFAAALHPYTMALVSAAPVPGKAAAERIILKGEPPNPADRPIGCAFHPCCPVATDRCRSEAPQLVPVAAARMVACHLVEAQRTPIVQVA
jgi:oligopeptide/dipeptide ABC transporter ATP-binding protein